MIRVLVWWEDDGTVVFLVNEKLSEE